MPSKKNKRILSGLDAPIQKAREIIDANPALTLRKKQLEKLTARN